MNENHDVQFSISGRTLILLGWAEIQAFQECHNMLEATVSVLCDIHAPLCAVSKLHLHVTLTAKQCLLNVGMQECSVHVNCNCDAITF